MNKYEVFEGLKSHGFEYAESSKEAIKLARMLLFAKGVVISDFGWCAVLVVVDSRFPVFG